MAKQDNKQEIKFELTNFNPNQIVDFSKWEKQQQQVVAENPFIEVVDNETWEIGKSRRTALRTARTTLEKERDDVKRELNNVKKFVANKYDEFIEITVPAEEKQQETVKAFEAKKEAEKQREAEAEEKRANDIRERIDTIEGQLDAVVLKMKHDTVDESRAEFDDIVDDANAQQFDEFGFLMNEAIKRQQEHFDKHAEMVIADEQKRLDELKVKQQSLINELYVQANQAIDVMTMDTIARTTKKIDEIFATDFDFGEFKEKFESVANQMFTKLERTVTTMKRDHEQMAIQEREREMTRQRNRIIEIREGLLDLIFQITPDNHNEQKLDIQKKLEKPEGLNPDLESDWEKMVDRVNQSFDQKFQMITQQLKQREFEKEQERRAKEQRHNARIKQLAELGMEFDKPSDSFFLTGSDPELDNLTRVSGFNVAMSTDDQWIDILANVENALAENKIHNERWDTRKPVMEKNGFVYDEIKETFEHKTFPGIKVALETVLTNGDESWRLVMNDLMDEIATAKANDKKEKARQKKLADGKSKLIEMVENISFPDGDLNSELDDLRTQMAVELNQWIRSKVEQIKKF